MYRHTIAILFGSLIVLLSLTQTAVASEVKEITWVGCGISKNAFMREMATAYKEKTGIKIHLQGGGATKGIREVATRKVDIGGTCRHVIENPRTYLTQSEERRVRLMPVAWDALAVLVHKDNPVDNITLAEIRDLYTGKITNWKQLGGNNEPIELYIRKGKISGVGRTLRELVFNNYEQDFVGKHVVKSSGPLEKAIVVNPRGIGITGISSARKLDAKLLELNNKTPSYENIKKGDYLLYRPLYIVTHLQEIRPEVKQFLNFIMSNDGRKVMRSVGTVPYEDAIGLWLKYLDQQNKALARGLAKR